MTRLHTGLVLFILVTANLRLFSQQTGRIRGLVADSIGQPVAGAAIRVDPDGHSAVTDQNGTFFLSGLFPGSYTVTTSSVGYQADIRKVSVAAGKPSPVLITLQADRKQLTEVSVARLRTNEDHVLGAAQSAQVVQQITRQQIEQLGSRRLDEVLREQTGMAIVPDLGSGNRAVGLQLQGFSSEYITILLNGQPMGGRHSGNFDLSRISVSDIERIEVIKGASCSFYGSEALGGTINIVTRQQVTDKRASAALSYGTYRTADLSASGEAPFAYGNGYVHLSANYYNTAGFNVNPYLESGKTAPPYHSLSMQGRSRWRVSKGAALTLTGRYANRRSVMDRNYGAMPTTDRLDEDDASGMFSLEHNSPGGHRIISRYYLTRYASEQDVHLIDNNRLLQANDFTEYLHRAEVQHSKALSRLGLVVSSGVGSEYQLNRAATDGAGGSMLQYFAYSQANYTHRQGLSMVLGLRFDGNTTYGGRLNPTAGISWQPLAWLNLQSSLGSGFKAPNYRQLYQQFTNLSQGYTVLGTADIQTRLQAMQASGEVQNLWPIAQRVTDLRPETSLSWNTQLTVKPTPRTEFSVNGFYNDIRNLIFSQQIGVKRNGSQLFSWFNIASMYSTGLELQGAYRPFSGLQLTLGYQLLDMKDRTVIDSIRNGQGRFARVRADGGIRASTTADYFGLQGRSRHMANAQLSYHVTRWDSFASLRAVYRGKYGFLDIDNNGFIDQYDVFVNRYVLINASVQQNFYRQRLQLQLTAENLGGYTDYLMPGQPGRMFTVTMRWRN